MPSENLCVVILHNLAAHSPCRPALIQALSTSTSVDSEFCPHKFKCLAYTLLSNLHNYPEIPWAGVSS